MSEPRDHYTKLLAETLQDDWANGPTAAFAQKAAAHARGRRRRRTALSLACAAAILTLAVVVGRRDYLPPPAESQVAAKPAPAAAKPAYEIISDEELMEQLRDRPLLAVKNADGSRELVVLPNE